MHCGEASLQSEFDLRLKVKIDNVEVRRTEFRPAPTRPAEAGAILRPHFQWLSQL